MFCLLYFFSMQHRKHMWATCTCEFGCLFMHPLTFSCVLDSFLHLISHHSFSPTFLTWKSFLIEFDIKYFLKWWNKIIVSYFVISYHRQMAPQAAGRSGPPALCSSRGAPPSLFLPPPPPPPPLLRMRKLVSTAQSQTGLPYSPCSKVGHSFRPSSTVGGLWQACFTQK